MMWFAGPGPVLAGLIARRSGPCFKTRERIRASLFSSRGLRRKHVPVLEKGDWSGHIVGVDAKAC
jgi:hypothetical protein